MSRIFRPLILAMVVALLALVSVGTLLANPSAPTDGGNGAGMSGQCTGAAQERPASCQSPNGHGE